MREEEDRKHIAEFEELGVARVRALVSQNQLPGRRGMLAGKWLDEKTTAAEAENTVLQLRGVKASETQAAEAKKATMIAVGSLVIAVLALIVAGLALFNDWKADVPATASAPTAEAPASSPPTAPSPQPAPEPPATQRAAPQVPTAPHETPEATE